MSPSGARTPICAETAKWRKMENYPYFLTDLAYFTVENGLTWGLMPGGVVKTCSNRILSITGDM